MKKATYLLPGALVLAGVWGTVAGSLQLNTIGVDMWIMSLISLFSFGALLFYRKDSKWQGFALMGALLLAVVLAVIFRNELKNELGAWANQLTHASFLRSGVYTPKFEASESGFFAGIFIAVIVGAFAFFAVRFFPRILVGICIILTVILTALRVISPSVWVFVLLAGFMMIFAWRERNHWKTTLLAGSIGVLFAALIGTVFFFSGQTWSKVTKGEESDWKFHKWQYENNCDSVLPEGKLETVDAFMPGGTPTFRVTMEKWNTLYLRGFTGCVYTGHSWDPIDTRTLTESAETLHRIQEDIFYPATQNGVLWERANVTQEGELTGVPTSVKIEYLSGCKAYSYFPVGSGADGHLLLNARYLRTEGNVPGKSIGFEGRVWPWTESYLLAEQLSRAAQETLAEYESAEAAYREFVYAHYLDVPENTLQVLDKYGLTGSEEYSTTEAKALVTEALNDLLEYKEGTVTRNGHGDFVSTVLEVNPSGHSVQFATLAAVILRTYGIPTRYCEGYLVTKGLADTMEDGGTLTLTERNSHAWVEYYYPGVGWLPFDPTPGYTKETEYLLPVGQNEPSEDPNHEPRPWQKPTPEDSPDRPDVKEEDATGGGSAIERTGEVLELLLAAVLMALILFIVRTALARKRLKKQRNYFETGDARRASGLMILTIKRLNDRIGREVDSETDEIAQRIWFSTHEIGEDTRTILLGKLRESENEWRKKVPFLQRFSERFLRAKVY